MSYPSRKELCGAYFRVKRDGKFENICLTDMTDEELEETLSTKDNAFLRNAVTVISKVLYDIAVMSEEETRTDVDFNVAHLNVLKMLIRGLALKEGVTKNEDDLLELPQE